MRNVSFRSRRPLADDMKCTAKKCAWFGGLLFIVSTFVLLLKLTAPWSISARVSLSENDLPHSLRRNEQARHLLHSLFSPAANRSDSLQVKSGERNASQSAIGVSPNSTNGKPVSGFVSVDLDSLGLDVGATWPEDSFCQEFLSHRFSHKLTPCTESNDRVVCYGSPYDDKMGECTITHVAIDTEKFYATMKKNRDSVEGSNSLWLLWDSNVNPCPETKFGPLDQYLQGGDYVKRVTKASILSSPKGKCDAWLNGTAFFFLGFDVHIYFKVLSWFSLHNGLLNYEKQGQLPVLIVRIPETETKFLFPDFEKRLFPDAPVVSLENLASSGKKVVCFEHIRLFPWAWSSTPFRCKMADAVGRLRQKCYNCNSRNLPGTRFMSFRRRALSACSIKDNLINSSVGKPEIKSIVLQVRKAYYRHERDDLSSFHRVFGNAKELESALQTGFPQAKVSLMHAEDLPICEQIRMAHDADVFVGVHGAGLVHLWWMRDHALLFELNPHSQLSNPTFKMLSALTGRRYYSYARVRGSEQYVTVDTQDVVNEIKKQY